MRIGKILSGVIVSVATLIVIATAAIIFSFFLASHRRNVQNFRPSNGEQATSPISGAILSSKASGDSSFLYRIDASSGKSVRLTTAVNGIESEPSFSHNGKYIVYSFASSPDSRSEVWLVGADGNKPHAITSRDQDALHPVFSPDDSKVFYAVSNFTGNHSPVVRPARHDWDVFSIDVPNKLPTANTVPTQITHGSFYDLRSLDVVADPLDHGGMKILISTTGYPIGALLEEFNLGASGRDKIFQPRVPGEPSMGPAYGEARFIDDGMNILFLAATNTSGGNYDYNVYSMSDVTGSEIKQLSHLTGMTTDLTVNADGSAAFVNGGSIHKLDIGSR
jgi:hypothetical protein